MSALSFNGISLTPGDAILRRDLHAALGGQTQSGISPSRRAPVVLLFSDPSSCEQHGYFDGWHEDGFFHYSGEGQHGDQVMSRGNKAIRDHLTDGRELHVFLSNGNGRPVTYAGQFECIDNYQVDAPEGNDGPLRTMIMFRLCPIDSIAPTKASTVSPAASTAVDEVSVEQYMTERMLLYPSREPIEAERREAKLVQDYKSFAEKQGRVMVRLRIQPQAEAKPLFTDLFDRTSNLLIEAKGTVTREAIRMSIGQLLDYRRFVTPSPRLAVLVPQGLRADLRNLLTSNGIGVIEQVDDGFSEQVP